MSSDTDTPIRRDAGRVPGAARAFSRQLPYDLLAQIRNPAAAFFSLGLPLIFLVTFTVIGAGGDDSAVYYAPATMAIAVVSGTLSNIAITLVYLREYGLLKRLQLMPVSRSALLGSRVAASGVLSLCGVVLLGVYAAAVHGAVPAQPATVVAAVLLLLLTGSALGLALTVVIPGESAAGPIANAVALPLLMISGGFFPLDSSPDWVRTLAAVLPIGSSLDAAVAGYDGSAVFGDLAAAALASGAWVAAASVLVALRFRWVPRHRR
ncbi:ABC transporter permease [Streptomyces sp. NPDC052013]|uniref:ABC transporter permease n=1 Tax=Streptomyces sp. NPDC052013 TaxID=3365679 RepID=UPI0037D166E9